MILASPTHWPGNPFPIIRGAQVFSFRGWNSSPLFAIQKGLTHDVMMSLTELHLRWCYTYFYSYFFGIWCILRIYTLKYTECFRFQTPPVLFSASTRFGVATSRQWETAGPSHGRNWKSSRPLKFTTNSRSGGPKSDFLKLQKTTFTPFFTVFLFFLPFWPSETYDFIYNSDFDSHTPTHDGLKSSDRDRTSFELGSRDRTRNPESPPWKLPHPLKMDGWKDSFLLGWRIVKHYVIFRECQCKFTFLVPKDTRELILVVDATLEDCGDVNEEAEVSFLSPERFKQLLLKVRSLLFDNFAMECCDHGGCWPQSFSDSDNKIGGLWTRIFQWSSSRFRSFHAKIFPGKNMSYFFRLIQSHKKSLRFHKVNQPNLRISKQINTHGACIGPVWCMFNCIQISRIL